MRCPKCGFEDSKVVDSRSYESGFAIRRRRECLNPQCGERFTTYERREETPIQVAKRDGTLEPFDRDKLRASLTKATIKRSIANEALDKLVSDIVAELRNNMTTTVTSSELGNMVLKRLLDLDPVAYVRFASVYKDFQDVESFYSELKQVQSKLDS
jgi:transcriptional repressor NrdR